MNLFSEKKQFAKTFIALAIAMMIILGSLVTVTAAISGTAAQTTETNDAAASKLADINAPANVIVLDVNGEREAVLFPEGTVAELLTLTNTKVGDNQIVIPSLSTVLTSETVVYVRNAKPVNVTADGQTKLMVLSYGKIADSLKLSGMPLSDEDILSVDRDAKVEDLSEVTIQRVTYKTVTETEEIAYESVTENSDKIDLGETKLSVEGKNGEKQIVKKVKYIDGKKESESVVSETVTKKPVDEVTLVGTKGAGSTGGAGTFTDMYGNKIAYSEVLTGSGTAYTAPAGSGTATGVTAYHGGVAINPNLIPYGSKLYVESTDGSFVYGYCTAVDTGGALMDGSAIVDCFYDTYDECVNFGRRDVNVYVIAEN